MQGLYFNNVFLQSEKTHNFWQGKENKLGEVARNFICGAQYINWRTRKQKPQAA